MVVPALVLVPVTAFAAFPKLPDLRTTRVSDPSASATVGDNFKVSVQVGNVGRGVAGRSIARVYLSRDGAKSASDIRLTAKLRFGRLGPSKKSTASGTVTVPAAAAPATYFLVACADDAREVRESREKNNCRGSARSLTVRSGVPGDGGGTQSVPGEGTSGGSGATQPGPGGGTTPSPAQLVVDATAHDFGTAVTGTTTTAGTFTVSNGGQSASGPLAVSVAGADSSQFHGSAGTCAGVSLAPGGTCTVQASFAPTSAGGKTATLQIAADPGGTVTVTLTGTGQNPSPASLQLDSAAHDYKAVTVGAATEAAFTVSNTGGLTSGALATSFTGPDVADFQILGDTCAGGTLAAGASCSLRVKFAPSSGAPKGATLHVDATPGGVLTADLTGSGTGAFYVAPTGSDTTGTGSATQPLLTINAAMAHAAAIGSTGPGRVQVRVAGPVTAGIAIYNEKVTLADGVELLGGYTCSGTCSSTQDPATYVTRISDTDFEGVLVPSSATAAWLDGFTITGKAGTPSSYGAAVTVAGGTPVLSNDKINGAAITGSAHDSYGVAVLGSTGQGPSISSSTVTGGSAAAGKAVGIGLLGPGTPVAVVSDSIVKGGTGASAAAISAAAPGSGTRVLRSQITAGTSNTASGSAWGIELFGGAALVDSNQIGLVPTGGCNASATSWCGGIMSAGAAATITNNRVVGGLGPFTTALLATQGTTEAPALRVNSNVLTGGEGTAGSISTAVTLMTSSACGACATSTLASLRNNILRGGFGETRYGVLESAPMGKTIHPAALTNNDFWTAPAGGHTDALYRIWNGSSSSDLLTIATVHSTVPGALNNLNADPVLGAGDHLTSGSPCRDAGTATEAPAADFDGDARPLNGAYDIGPDEYHS
jgi:hypothetical protein